MRLDIQHTWDGQPIPESEQTMIWLAPAGDDLQIELSAPWHGDPPPPTEPGPTPGLWRYEVIELFIAGPTDKYLEIELGPAGHFLVLRLAGVRKAIAQVKNLDYTATREGERWRGEARVPLRWLPKGPYRINAYAIHGRGDARRHLAWSPVFGEKPDFHQLEWFRPGPTWLGQPILRTT